MKKLNMKTANLTEEKYKKLKELFPNVITETIDEDGHVIRAIDSEILSQEINSQVIKGSKERYQFNWPDKKKAILFANNPSKNTLRLDRNKSIGKNLEKNSINSKNIYIEGDNLEVLKIIRETYLGKIGTIYIDPPYNTGRNLIYKNDFRTNKEDFLIEDNQLDENRNRLVENTDINGRFHTDWLNMIYPRLKLSRDLLRDDGIIIVSTDENELGNLIKVLDEIFFHENYVGTIVVRCNPQGRNKKNIDPTHEYHLIYAKNKELIQPLKIKNDNTNYKSLIRSGTNSYKYQRPYRFYPILVKNNKVEMITKEEYSQIYKNGKFDDKFIQQLNNKYEQQGYKVIYPLASDGQEKVWNRKFDRVLDEYQNYIYDKGKIKYPAEEFKTPQSLWTEAKYSNVTQGTNHLKKIFNNESIFDFPKSIETIKDLIMLNSQDNDLILDFFSGSGTTGEAVIQLNNIYDKNLQFILVQIPEELNQNNRAYSQGFKDICEVARERVFRSSKTLFNETKKSVDYGFRTFTLDSSNMKDFYYTPENISQASLMDMVSNVKEDRTPEDLLIQVMLELGIDLSAPIKEIIDIGDNKIFSVADEFLVACFDNNITESTVELLAKLNPTYAAFKEPSDINGTNKGDEILTNFDEIFKTYSPKTKRMFI